MTDKPESGASASGSAAKPDAKKTEDKNPVWTWSIPKPMPREPGMEIEDWISKVRFSARGYKARLTLAISAANRGLDIFAASPSRVAEEECRKDISNMEKALAMLQFRMQELMDNALTEKAFKGHEADLEEYTELFQDARRRIMEAILEAELPPESRVTKGDDDDDDNSDDLSSAAADYKRQFKVNSALKPEKLTSESSPQDLRTWLNQF